MKKAFLIFILQISVWAIAQDTLLISRVELEQKSLDNNLQLKLAQNETQLAEAELLATRATYLPNINLSYTFTNTDNPLMAFGSKLNQERIAMEDFDPNYLNDPDNISNFATKLEVRQPVVNMEAVYLKKAGVVKTEVLKIKEERTKEYIRLEVKKAYMMLQLAYKMLETFEGAKVTTLANKQVVDNYFKNGMIQKHDALYMEVRLNEIENQIQFARSNILNASDYLFLLLNEDSKGKVYKPAESLEYQNGLLSEEPSLDKNRKDLQAYQKSLEAYDWLIKSSGSKLLPSLNAFGSFELYDKDFARFDANGYLVGVQLSWNVFDGLRTKSEQATYKAQQAKAQTEIDQYMQQSELELSRVYRQVLDANNKVSLTQLAWDQSREAYRIRKNRYDQGLERSSDLLMAETLMSQKELEYQQAVFEYNTALEFYRFLN